MSESNGIIQPTAGGENGDTKDTVPVKDAEIDQLIGAVEKISLGDELDCQLGALQCPFTWKLREMLVHRSSKQVITRLEEKEEEMEGEEGPFLLFRQCGVQFALCYENWCEGDVAAARECQRKCEKLIESSDDIPCLDAVKHISKSCAAYLSRLSGMLSDSRSMLKTIVPFEELDTVNKACILGMRGIVLMEYGYEGTSQAVSYIEKALELDPSSAEWHFLLGKSLRRIRKLNSYNEIPEKRELKALEKAVELSSCSGYCTFLAQTYRETAFRVYSLNKNNLDPFKKALNIMNEKSAEYYRKALKMAPESSHINIRCALGFLNLPHPYRDERLAKECIDKALQLAPNNAMAHHVAGKYYERHGELEAAKRSYKSSGEYGAYGAYMDYIRLEFKTNPEYDPLPLLNEMLNKFKEEPYRVGALSQIGTYYYLIKDDLKKAVTYLLQIMDENHDTDRLKTYKPVCLFIKKPFDLLQVIVDEVQLALSEENISPEEVALYKRLISVFQDSEILASPPKSHRQEILEESEKTLKEEKERSMKSRGRERGGKRGRGNYHEQRGGRGRGRGRGSGERGRGRARGFYRSGDRRDSSCDSSSNFRRHDSKERHGYKKSWNRDSSCESNSSRKDSSRNWRSRKTSEEGDGDSNNESSSNQSGHNSWRQDRAVSSYHGSYKRDSSCDSVGSHGSTSAREGSRRNYQKHGRNYNNLQETERSFEKDARPNWRGGTSRQRYSFQGQDGTAHISSSNKGNWRERQRERSSTPEEYDRGKYRGSMQGYQHHYRKNSSNRNRDSSAESYTSDHFREPHEGKHFHQNFHRSRHNSGTDVTKPIQSEWRAQSDKTFMKRPVHYKREADNVDSSRYQREQRVEGTHTTRNDEAQQKLRARKEMSFRIRDQKAN